jgi:uncharacterized protein YqgC (DUF456 family)
MSPTLWWVLAILMIVAGAVGTFLPAIPGVPLVFVGMLLAAWIDHFTRIGWITLTVLGVLTALALGIDILATVMGAKRAGASRLALLGAAIGTVVGLFFGIPGILLGPFVGAAAGELVSRRSVEAAARVGVATWIALLISSVAKAAILCLMIGIFVAAYLVHRNSVTWL